jgi:predicted NUDIX family NTP pyrophosphohydrolase
MRNFILTAGAFTLLACPGLAHAAGEDNAAWGKPVGGLQAGIRPAAGERGVSGSVVEYELVVRNIQEHGIVLLSYPEGLWYAGKADEGVVELGAGTIAGSSPPVCAHLEPGKEVVLGRAFIGLTGSKLRAGYRIALPPGKYRVGTESVMPPAKLVPPTGAIQPGARYCPKLRTGYLDLVLRPAE